MSATQPFSPHQGSNQVFTIAAAGTQVVNVTPEDRNLRIANAGANPVHFRTYSSKDAVPAVAAPSPAAAEENELNSADDELNSDDDDDDDDGLGGGGGGGPSRGAMGGGGGDDGDNTILCQFEKYRRARDQWKVTLKGGVATINGKSFAFSHCDAEFAY